jgi:hypothetical protein
MNSITPITFITDADYYPLPVEPADTDALELAISAVAQGVKTEKPQLRVVV